MQVDLLRKGIRSLSDAASAHQDVLTSAIGDMERFHGLAEETIRQIKTAAQSEVLNQSQVADDLESVKTEQQLLKVRAFCDSFRRLFAFAISTARQVRN